MLYLHEINQVRPGRLDAFLAAVEHDYLPLAERLGAAGRSRADEWTYTPEEYADRVVELVERAVEARRS